MPLPHLRLAAALSVGLSGFLLLSGTAVAQKAVTIADAFIGQQDASVDGIVRFTVANGAIKTATADLCFAANPFSIEVDRTQVSLAKSADGWSGVGTTQIGAVPVKVALSLEEKAGNVALSGTVDWAGTAITLPAQEREAQNDEAPEPFIREAWAANQVVATVPSGRMPALLAALREVGGDLETSGLVPSCVDLRAGLQSVTVTVAPERAAALRDRIGAVGGLKATAFAKTGFDNSVRFPAAKITGGFGAAGERPVADAVLAAALQLLPGSSASEALHREEASGRWTVKILRSAPFLETLDLGEIDAVSFLVNADPADPTKAVLTFEETSGQMVAKNPGKLRLAPPSTPMESLGSYVLSGSAFLTALSAKVAVRLDGQIYDTVAEAWKAP